MSNDINDDNKYLSNNIASIYPPANIPAADKNITNTKLEADLRRWIKEGKENTEYIIVERRSKVSYEHKTSPNWAVDQTPIIYKSFTDILKALIGGFNIARHRYKKVAVVDVDNDDGFDYILKENNLSKEDIPSPFQLSAKNGPHYEAELPDDLIGESIEVSAFGCDIKYKGYVLLAPSIVDYKTDKDLFIAKITAAYTTDSKLTIGRLLKLIATSDRVVISKPAGSNDTHPAVLDLINKAGDDYDIQELSQLTPQQDIKLLNCRYTQLEEVKATDEQNANLVKVIRFIIANKGRTLPIVNHINGQEAVDDNNDDYEAKAGDDYDDVNDDDDVDVTQDKRLYAKVAVKDLKYALSFINYADANNHDIRMKVTFAVKHAMKNGSSDKLEGVLLDWEEKGEEAIAELGLEPKTNKCQHWLDNYADKPDGEAITIRSVYKYCADSGNTNKDGKFDYRKLTTYKATAKNAKHEARWNKICSEWDYDDNTNKFYRNLDDPDDKYKAALEEGEEFILDRQGFKAKFFNYKPFGDRQADTEYFANHKHNTVATLVFNPARKGKLYPIGTGAYAKNGFNHNHLIQGTVDHKTPYGQEVVNAIDTLLFGVLNFNKYHMEVVKLMIANILFEPHLKHDWAPFIVGPKGIGKGIFFDNLVPRLLNWRYCASKKAVDIVSNFNSSFFQKKIYCVADEVNYTLNVKQHESIINRLITANKGELEGKGKDQRDINTYTNYVFLSNLTDWPISKEERRYHTVFNGDMDPYNVLNKVVGFADDLEEDKKLSLSQDYFYNFVEKYVKPVVANEIYVSHLREYWESFKGTDREIKRNGRPKGGDDRAALTASQNDALDYSDEAQSRLNLRPCIRVEFEVQLFKSRWSTASPYKYKETLMKLMKQRYVMRTKELRKNDMHLKQNRSGNFKLHIDVNRYSYDQFRDYIMEMKNFNEHSAGDSQ